MDTPDRQTAIEAEILRRTDLAGPTKSICPSEVARALHPQWRSLLAAVRGVAVRLAQSGQIEILRKGHPIDPTTIKGVIRLRKAGA